MLLSPPSRRRGLKFRFLLLAITDNVASFSEAWIEIDNLMLSSYSAPPSPPSRRRGLKSGDKLVLTKSLCRLLLGGVD